MNNIENKIPYEANFNSPFIACPCLSRSIGKLVSGGLGADK